MKWGSFPLQSASPPPPIPGPTNGSCSTDTLNTKEDEGPDPGGKVYCLAVKKCKHIVIKREQTFQGKMFGAR